MMLLVTSLLFSGFLMTSVYASIVPPVMDDPVYVFDVRTDAPVSDVKAALSGVNLRHSFKVIGEDRYMLVATSKNVEDLRGIDFPAGAEVTQYPAGHIEDFLQAFGASAGWEEDYDAAGYFDDTVLTFADWSITLPDDVTNDEYFTIMKDFASRFIGVHMAIKPLMYSVVGSYPPRFFNFLDIEANSLNTLMTSQISDSLGGPASMTHDVCYVVKV